MEGRYYRVMLTGVIVWNNYRQQDYFDQIIELSTPGGKRFPDSEVSQTD